ncbi:hypothetical protein Aconfl_22220 [Algoriphagus confluentis]|uniref:Uncharacterized protein n=1 Tax=Algoriphagus confluentis TaxID=1697556 RepID=A0ABQ6PNL6_9BACT|nr:hypothetical protein Aconfl_22220 [Algoriphagus confluentis]
MVNLGNSPFFKGGEGDLQKNNLKLISLKDFN